MILCTCSGADLQVVCHSAISFSLQLQEGFGWEPFIQLFANYQTLTGLPQNNEDKMNLWVKKFSEVVQKNLAPFFKAWGWPVQHAVAKSLASLPEWQENPMKMYTAEGTEHTEWTHTSCSLREKIIYEMQ